MTQIVVEDLQQSSKNLKHRTQCSREIDQNNKQLSSSAEENGALNYTESYVQ